MLSRGFRQLLQIVYEKWLAPSDVPVIMVIFKNASLERTARRISIVNPMALPTEYDVGPLTFDVFQLAHKFTNFLNLSHARSLML